jgi:DNA-binding CsgD family transcriptional regulator
MFLSVHTIAFHLRRVFCKLDVSSRVQLASLAAEQDGSPPVARQPLGVS